MRYNKGHGDETAARILDHASGSGIYGPFRANDRSQGGGARLHREAQARIRQTLACPKSGGQLR